MAKVRALLVLRAAALVALLGSSALTIDYLSPVPSFCGASSGCGVVQHSGWGYLGSARIPLPALGLVGFTVVLTLSLLPGSRRFAAAPVALAGGFAAVGLLLLQWLKIGAFCVLCMIVDAAGIVAALAGAACLWWPERKAPGEGSVPPSQAAAREPLHDFAWIALGALAVLAPLVWPSVKPADDVPREIAKHHQPGKINVIEFVDFECPFCRMYHPELKKVIDEFGEKVNFVRLDLPLAMHPRARGAARAHLCAVAKGRGEALADLLMESEDLTEPNLVKLGAKAGLEPDELERCMKDPRTDEAAGANEAMLTRLGLLEGLPTTFIGSKMLVGAALAPELRDAFEQAAIGPKRGVPGALYVAVCALVAAASVAGGWYAKREKSGAPAASVS